MRCAEFDRDQVLTQAMEAFRTNGYAKTTMQDLVAATGLHPGSLYAAFGNKRGLLLEAVDHYIAMRSQSRLDLLAGHSPLKGIHVYLLHMVDEMLRGTCLVTRAVMELDQDDELHQRMCRIHSNLEADLNQALTDAVAAGEIPANADIPALTAYLQVGVQGLVTYSQCRNDPALLQAVVGQLLAGLTVTR